MKKMLIGLGLLAMISIAAAAIWYAPGSGGNSPLEAMVRNGKLERCPKHTLSQMADSFLSSPAWERGKTRDGLEFVNVRGGLIYMEKPVEAAVQFMVDRKAGKFTLHAFELNGIPQTGPFRRALIRKMCDRAALVTLEKEETT
ncbi:MAG: hypothetical protein IIC13_15365 [SAR324 cluster bacterium]|nr:hypothetical protein [SAR324 cluster bacterium]MCH8887961.1 hypothetical protein [SAR324 cluster bacterium]